MRAARTECRTGLPKGVSGTVFVSAQATIGLFFASRQRKEDERAGVPPGRRLVADVDELSGANYFCQRRL